jgi:fatty acid synthase subunit alpha, fungi type
MKDIEIVATETAPIVKLSGDAEKAAETAGVKGFELSISHSETVVQAFVVAKK